MKRKYLVLALSLSLVFACKENKPQKEETVEANTQEKVESTVESKIIPIEHATAVLEWGDLTIYIDPVGGEAAFEGQKSPDLVLVTDEHGDHFNLETLKAVNGDNTKIIMPEALAVQVPEDSGLDIVVLNNGESQDFSAVNVEAIPMYNLREEALNFHTKGRGNGYVLTLGDERIYFSGDTEDIPEMRELKNIDKAFVCMNLPYTMTVESAADAVLEFKPKEVYPYHYRGRPDVSDVAKFKQLVNEGDSNIKVVQLDWYPNDDF